MSFDQDAPLNRIKGESQKAHSSLMDYWLMGAGRSLRKLFDEYQRQANGQQETNTEPTKEPPTKSWWTLSDWSKNNHWQARVARQIEIDNDIFLEQYRQRYMPKEEVLARLSDQARGDMGSFARVRSQADLEDHTHSALVKSLTQHHTQTQRGEGEDARSEIKARITLGLYDAQEALKLLAKHYGLFDADHKAKIDISVEESPLDKIRSALDSIAANIAEADDTEQPDQKGG